MSKTEKRSPEKDVNDKVESHLCEQFTREAFALLTQKFAPALSEPDADVAQTLQELDLLFSQDYKLLDMNLFEQLLQEAGFKKELIRKGDSLRLCYLLMERVAQDD